MILDHAAASLEDPASGSLLAAFQSLRATLIGSMPAWRHHARSSRERCNTSGSPSPARSAARSAMNSPSHSVVGIIVRPTALNLLVKIGVWRRWASSY
jgi:hypothetical protein